MSDKRCGFGENLKHNRELECESAAVHVGMWLSVGTGWRLRDVSRVQAGDPKGTPQ
jgi:hypothetical protein